MPASAQQAPFVDPAILSYTKPTITTRIFSRDSQTNAKPQIVSPVMIADGDKPITASPARTIKRERKDSTATATLTEPFNHMAIEDKALSESNNKTKPPVKPGQNGAEEAVPTPQKKSKRGRKGKDNGSQTAPGIIDVKDLHSSPVTTKNTQVRGKGWRQTPLTRDTTPRKKNRHQNGKVVAEDANGWATEDATDIQDLGEFDFQTNLSKFDKRRVFDDIRKDDVTTVEERLVSFNRKFRPGTNNGKNLHYTENVLDPPRNNNVWKSEAGETEEDEEGSAHRSRYSSSRASRRDRSHSRKTTSRKGSTVLAASVTSTSRLARGATGSSLTNSPLSSHTHLAAAQGSANTAARSSLRVLSTNKPCPTISTFQMLELESLCTTELGLSEDILTENAGRGIAETVLKVSPSSTSSSTPSVLILAGNHKSGTRTVAAARHLRNRGVRVTVCVLGGERETDLLESLRRQLDVYRKSGGWVVRWDEFYAKHNADGGAAQQPNPPDVVVDALLGMHLTFDILRLDDQSTAWEMVGWVNWLVSGGSDGGGGSAETTTTKANGKVKAPNPKGKTRQPPAVFSIDVPFGLDPTSGLPTLVDSNTLVLRTSHIIALGAPKVGLVEALFRIAAEEHGSGSGSSDRGWDIWVVDLGIGVAAWKKGSAGSRRRTGVEFGREWTVRVGVGLAPTTGATTTTTTTGGRGRGAAPAPAVVVRE